MSGLNYERRVRFATPGAHGDARAAFDRGMEAAGYKLNAEGHYELDEKGVGVAHELIDEAIRVC